MAHDILVFHSDGASRGNPGPSAAAFAVFDPSGNILEEGARFLGNRTNNEAEYEALIWAMESARAHSPRIALFRSDSELLVRQVNGAYEIRAGNLKRLWERVSHLRNGIRGFELAHVPREDPRAKHVDELANKAIDEALAKS